MEERSAIKAISPEDKDFLFSNETNPGSGSRIIAPVDQGQQLVIDGHKKKKGGRVRQILREHSSGFFFFISV